MFLDFLIKKVGAKRIKNIFGRGGRRKNLAQTSSTKNAHKDDVLLSAVCSINPLTSPCCHTFQVIITNSEFSIVRSLSGIEYLKIFFSTLVSARILITEHLQKIDENIFTLVCKVVSPLCHTQASGVTDLNHDLRLISSIF